METTLSMHITRLFLPIIALALTLSACGGAPTRTDANASARAADIAQRFIGKPYRYGGETPAGFDCSGLVHYSFGRAGIAVPRTTGALVRDGRRVARGRLRKGDLLFFNQDGKRASHVAIYLGDQTFVHAPSSGKHVRRDRLNNPYWRKHFAGARRVD